MAKDRSVERSVSIEHDELWTRFLIVTKEFRWPPNSGGTIRTLHIAKELSRDASVTVVSPEGVWRIERGDSTVDQQKSVASSSDAEERHAGLHDRILDLLWACRYSRSISGMRMIGSGLRRALLGAGALEAEWAGVVIDHTCLFGLRNLAWRGRPRLLASMHNIESDLARQRASASKFIRALAFMWDSRVLKIEERASGWADAVIVTSEADATHLVKNGLESPSVLPNGFDFTEIEQSEDLQPLEVTAGDRLVFVGALDWTPNVNGLLWLIKSRAWNDLISDRPGIKLQIIGRNPTVDLQEAVSRAPAVELIANPRRIVPLLRGASLGVVPLREGGGTRLKIIEYLACKVPVVSTELGASGIEGIDPRLMRLTPDSLDDFVEAIKIMLEAGERPSAEDVLELQGRFDWSRTLSSIGGLLR